MVLPINNEGFSMATSVKFDDDLKSRIQHLADIRHRSAHWIMREAICEALRDWRRKRALQDQEIEELRDLWREGVESGKGQYSSMEEIKQAARRRLSVNDR